MTINKIIPKTYFTIAFLLLTLMLFASACKKNNQPEEDEFPPLTHEGKNTFGCKVNGENWVAKTSFSISGPVPLHGSYNENDGKFVLIGTKEDQEILLLQDIIIKSDSIGGVGSFEMAIYDHHEQGLKDYYDNLPCGTYLHDSLYPGTINITFLNLSENIISGTFEMELKPHQNCSGEDNIVITDGRFDFKY